MSFELWKQGDRTACLSDTRRMKKSVVFGWFFFPLFSFSLWMRDPCLEVGIMQLIDGRTRQGGKLRGELGGRVATLVQWLARLVQTLRTVVRGSKKRGCTSNTGQEGKLSIDLHAVNQSVSGSRHESVTGRCCGKE